MSLTGKLSDSAAVSGCNYQTENVDVTAVSSASDPQSGILHQHLSQQHLPRHQFQTDQGTSRALPPQYESLQAAINNNNSYSSVERENDVKYQHLTTHLFDHGHSYYHRNRYPPDHGQNHDQQVHDYQLDYCNSLSYAMTSSSSSISASVAASRAGYCSRPGQFDLVAAAAAYSAGETRTPAVYWPAACGVGTDGHLQAADLDDQADVKPTLLDPPSYLMHGGQYAGPRHQGYPPSWYQYGWNVPYACNSAAAGYYSANSGFSDAGVQSTSPPMHHILRGVYNTLQVTPY